MQIEQKRKGSHEQKHVGPVWRSPRFTLDRQENSTKEVEKLGYASSAPFVHYRWRGRAVGLTGGLIFAWRMRSKLISSEACCQGSLVTR